MPKQSAGLLMFRRTGAELEVFLVHPGGPFWAKKDAGAWAVPKGEYVSPEYPLAAAQREFKEETGFDSAPPFMELGTIRQAGGKVVTSWAFEGDCDAAKLRSNTCEIEWPPRSGKRLAIPEVDEGRWFTVEGARGRMRADHFEFVGRLQEFLRKSA